MNYYALAMMIAGFMLQVLAFCMIESSKPDPEKLANDKRLLDTYRYQMQDLTKQLVREQQKFGNAYVMLTSEQRKQVMRAANPDDTGTCYKYHDGKCVEGRWP